MANELKSITGNKQEAERRRKQLESQVSVAVVNFFVQVVKVAVVNHETIVAIGHCLFIIYNLNISTFIRLYFLVFEC